MKILHLIDSGGLYGAEVMLLNLATEQRKLGLTVEIGSIRIPGIEEKPIEKEAKTQGIPVKTFAMNPGLNPFGAWRILRYARQGGFDLIHSHGYKTNILIGLLPGVIRGFPMVSTLHGWTTAGGWTKMRANEWLDSVALRFVDRIVLVNQGMMDKPEIRNLPRHKICIINNGIDISETSISMDDCVYPDKSIALKIRQFCKQGTIIASIGRLSVEKGFSHLIKAVGMLRGNGKADVRLLLVGDGRLRTQLQKEAEDAGLKDFFLITGYIKNARTLLAMVDIYAISSLTEGLPITLLEVMASETPIVATKVGGIPHVVENGTDTLLVPAKDPGALSQAIMKLIQNPELARRLSHNAKIKVQRIYTRGIMAEKYSAMYKEVIHKRILSN